MRKLILFSTLIILTVGCKKQSSTPSPKYNPEHGRLIATHYIRNQFVRETLLYTYDASARLSVTRYAGNSSTNYCTYTTNQVTSVAGSFTLSAGNAIILMFYNPEYRMNVWDTYQYDGDGYLVGELDTIPDYYGMEASYKYLNNNCISATKIYNFSYQAGYTMISYFVYSTALNTIGNYNNGIYYLGKDNVNLPSARFDVQNGDTSGRTYYTYEFNNDSTVHICYTAYTQAGNTQHDTDIFTYY